MVAKCKSYRCCTCKGSWQRKYDRGRCTAPPYHASTSNPLWSIRNGRWCR